MVARELWVGGVDKASRIHAQCSDESTHNDTSLEEQIYLSAF